MEDFVTFEIAKKLKEKGFKEKCLCHYIGEDIVYNIESPIANNQMWFSHNSYDNIWHRDNIDAPTISQVLKWLRKEKDIHIEIFLYNGTYSYIAKSITKISEDDYFHQCLNEDTTNMEYENYEEAELAGIEYVLNNLI